MATTTAERRPTKIDPRTGPREAPRAELERERVEARGSMEFAAGNRATSDAYARARGGSGEGPVIQRLRGRSTSAGASLGTRGRLPERLLESIRSLSGHDLSDVLVHRGSSRPEGVGALAYADRSQIHLGPGQEQHLGHEAWHVVQQREGRVRATGHVSSIGAGGEARRVAINEEPALEREADAMGARAQRGEVGTASASARAGGGEGGGGGAIQRLTHRGTTVEIEDLDWKTARKLLFLAERGWVGTMTPRGYVVESRDVQPLRRRVEHDNLTRSITDPTELTALAREAKAKKKPLSLASFSLSAMDTSTDDEEQARSDVLFLDLVRSVVRRFGSAPSFAVGEEHTDEIDQELQTDLMDMDMFRGIKFIFETSSSSAPTLRRAMTSRGSSSELSEVEVKHLEKIKSDGSDAGKVAKSRKIQRAMSLHRSSSFFLGGSQKVGKHHVANYELAQDIIGVARVVHESLTARKDKKAALSAILKFTNPKTFDKSSAEKFLSRVGFDVEGLTTLGDVEGTLGLFVGGAHPFDVDPLVSEASDVYNLMDRLGLGFTIIRERAFYEVIERIRAKHKDEADAYMAKFTYLRGKYRGRDYLLVIPAG
ncbi:MAG: DUF4157 domain-containing protein [Nannocystaceae bacterium]